MDNKVDASKVISILANRVGALEAQNAMLQAQLESGDDDGKQDTKS